MSRKQPVFAAGQTRTISIVSFFFFSSRRRHTRCSRDWSSDVCSSDLEDFAKQKQQPAILFNYTAGSAAMTMKDFPAAVASFRAVLTLNPDDPITSYNQIGRASCRERV